MNPEKLKKIVVLTGAGISAESGIKTFRASDGLWESHRVEEVASMAGFLNNPSLVHHFYNQRRRELLSKKIQPNSAHLAIARFETKTKAELVIITQNIDNLHERAGSKQVFHMHGELLKIICQNSSQVFEWREDLSANSICTCCHKKNLRPHIVWFGEIPLHMNRIENDLNTCDLFISIGTSGNVYPANQFVEIAKSCGAYTVELNLEHSQQANVFHAGHYGEAGKIVPKYLDSIS